MKLKIRSHNKTTAGLSRVSERDGDTDVIYPTSSILPKFQTFDMFLSYSS